MKNKKYRNSFITLKKKLTARFTLYFISIFGGFIIALMLIYTLISGSLGTLIAKFLEYFFHMDYYTASNIYWTFRNYFEIPFICLAIVIILFVSFRLCLKTYAKYLIEIQEALNKMTYDNSAEINLSYELSAIEGNLFSYIHDGGGSIIGTLLKLEADDVNDETVKQCAKDICLQIAASAPQFVSQSDVPAEVLAEEKEVQMNLAQKENEEAAKPKPQNVLEKIVEGRMKKFTEEICLMDEPYIKNDEMTVAKYVASLGKNIKVVQFVRYEKGEGLQKKEENFADEVASMMK